MKFVVQLWRGEAAWARWASSFAVLTLALAVRMVAARDAYPVPGDGGHFVQHGIEFAHGNPAGLSTYWSQGMVVIASEACKLDWPPARTLQVVTVGAGVAVVGTGMMIAWLLFGGWAQVLLAGLLMAVNPTLVHYSVAAYSEMPFMACVFAGSALLLAGSWRLLPGYALLGLAAYFKGTDGALIAAAATLLCGLRAMREGRQIDLALTCAGFGLFLLIMLPLCLHTYRVDGIFGPGSKGINLALGDSWSDSKAVYGTASPWHKRQEYLVAHGTVGYLWEYRVEIATRWIRNAAQAVRILTDEFFAGPFHMGPAWFVFLALGAVVLGWRRHRLSLWFVPLFLTATPLAFICLCLVHERLAIMALAGLLLLAADCLALLLCDAQAKSSQAQTRILALILAVFFAKYAQLSAHAAEQEWFYWRYPNMVAVAQRLRAYGDDRDLLMANGPHVAISFFKEHPLRSVDVPYGSVDEVEACARDHHVTLVVLSDQARTHWPITALFSGTPAPSNWTLLAEMTCPGDDATGRPDERYRIYRRQDL